MAKLYDMDEIEEMVLLIHSYSVEYDDCHRVDCAECDLLECCYSVARQKEDSAWAKLINYGGYDTEEEFWEQ